MIQAKLRRSAEWALVRLLRIMGENDDRTAERDEGGVEDGGVGVVEVAGEVVKGERKAADEGSVEDGGVGVGGVTLCSARHRVRSRVGERQACGRGEAERRGGRGVNQYKNEFGERRPPRSGGWRLSRSRSRVLRFREVK